MSRGQNLQRAALVIDGLVFESDNWVEPFLEAGVTAIHMTVPNVLSDFEGCCDQVAQILRFLSLPESRWHPILKTDDFDIARNKGRVGLILGWQNSRPIADRLERLAFFHRLGLRIMQLTYNERNLIGDGCLESNDAGLSDFGRRAVSEMSRLGIAVDLSHCSERTCLDAIDVVGGPVLVTHANAKAVSDVPRNKSDTVLKAVAEAGGIAGVSVYGPMCWNGDTARRPQVRDFLDHLYHIVDVVGHEHVALGTDFPVVRDPSQLQSRLARNLARYPGALARYAAAFGNGIEDRYLEDCSTPQQLYRITDALLADGWSEDHVRMFLGENLRRTLRTIWKEEERESDS